MKNIITEKLDDLAEHLSNDQPANTFLGFAQKIGRPLIYTSVAMCFFAIAFAIVWIAVKITQWPPAYVVAGLVTLALGAIGVRELGKGYQMKARAETIDDDTPKL